MDWKQTSRDYGPQGRSILLFGLGKTISSPAAQLGVREDTSPLLPLEPVPVPATAQHHPTLPRHRGQAAAPCPRDTAGVTSIPCELPLKNQNVTDTCATSRCPGAAGRPLRCGWERRTNHAEDEQRKGQAATSTICSGAAALSCLQPTLHLPGADKLKRGRRGHRRLYPSWSCSSAWSRVGQTGLPSGQKYPVDRRAGPRSPPGLESLPSAVKQLGATPHSAWCPHLGTLWFETLRLQ
nr:uncharacterized protein LOC110366168 isoform X5 [Columba livia]